MEYKILEKPGFRVVGVSVNTTVQNAPKDCPVIWEEFMKRYKEIKNYVGGMKNYGVCFEKSKEKCEFQYIACCEVSEFENIPENMVMAEVEKSKYAVFTHKGKLEKLGETYGGIMEIFKEKGLKQKPFWFEFYDHRWKGDKPDSLMEIWCAIE